ncbi:MAG: 2-succinyl-5-enolpyruvyl-6-hydroxy-3-cyclohexene-1-carboxylic-acid synthase, partial [Clostridia bacterium]|nr:2-succinyl-5-enolpyruvyl-6-hydroxy-3-cyclohexene-1-carboxylic-acid synthase [Clostridia bacterium]
MYTDIISYQIVISLLKKYGIKHLVLSAGSRHTPFVRSVEGDDYFTCYSVVDERSAGFFAIGLIMELKEPVVICCTSGTSVSNYASAMSEAYYQGLPLIAITTDRNNYYLYQQEEQCIPQANIFNGICKKSVTLPLVESKKDFWYCSRLVNEALLATNHHGSGPVHINVPVEEKLFSFTTESLPEVVKINRIEHGNETLWAEKAKDLSKYNRIIVSYGQNEYPSSKLVKNVEMFTQKYSAIIMAEHLSNLHCKGSINPYNALRVKYTQIQDTLAPDLVIFVNGNSVEIREWLKHTKEPFIFWNVRPDGEISDPLRCLTDLFECDAETFFAKMIQYAPAENIENTYLTEWTKLCEGIKMPNIEYSDL